MENGSVMVDFGRPFVPEAGEHDVYIEDVRTAGSRFGKVLYLDLILLDEQHKGEGFSLLYGFPRPGRKLNEQSKLGQLLAQMGFPIADWSQRGVKVDLRTLLVGRRMRIVTGITVKEGQMGTFETATLAAVKKVYEEGEGPTLPGGEVPF